MCMCAQTHAHSHVESKASDLRGRHAHPCTARQKSDTLRYSGKQTHKRVCPLICTLGAINIPLQVCSHMHTCREPFALNQLLSATDLRLPTFLDSVLTPSLDSCLLHSAQSPHRSHVIQIRILQSTKLQQHLAASSAENLDWHSKPYEMRPFPTFLASPAPPVSPSPHSSPLTVPAMSFLQLPPAKSSSVL